MEPDEETILTVAQIVRDCEAMAQAALAKDFGEARFRARLVAEKAVAANLPAVAAAATHAIERLGPAGGVPRSNHGAAVLRVASALDAFWFDAH